jgi:hypothetical protein
MMLSWFDAKEAKAFGENLAKFYLDNFKNIENSKSEKIFNKKKFTLLENLKRQIAVYKHCHKLNIYKKAQAGNAFKWHLLQAGLDPDHAEVLTSWVVREL